MTLEQAIVAIIVAIVGSTGATLGFVQFLIKRKDDKEEKSIEDKIDEILSEKMKQVHQDIDDKVSDSIRKCGEIGDKAISDVVDKMREEFQEGLQLRSEEGRQRFEANSKQIVENTAQIGEILTIVRKQTEQYDAMVQSLTTLNESVSTLNTQFVACADGVNSNLYDKISIVAKKALKRKAITTTEKTNLRQLWESYKKLGGTDETLRTYYEECGKLETINDEEA